MTTRIKENRPRQIMWSNLLVAIVFFFVLGGPALLAQDDDSEDDADSSRETLRITPEGERIEEGDDFSWAITRYRVDDVEDVTDDINETLETGDYLPVGIEADPDIAILMIRDDSIDFSNWMIYEFDDAEELEAEFNGFLTEGWVPMDIARTPNGITTLFIESEIEINGWRLTTSEATEEGIEQAVTELRDEGYSVWGQALDGEGMWHLGLREVGLTEPRSSLHESYDDDPENVQSRINENIERLWVPWGMSLAGGRIYISYLQ